MSQKPIGVLLVQLGTPDAPTPRAVKSYLAEFLGDKAVVDLPYVIRKALLHGVILRTRPKQSAKAYEAIWDPGRGSPLRFHTEDLVDALQKALGADYLVRYAMRYGAPKIDQVLSSFAKEVSRVVILPLFPQFAAATTGSVITEIERFQAKRRAKLELDVIQSFYDNPGFIDALSRPLLQVMQQGPWDKILMSFHSLPVRQIQKAKQGCQASCFAEIPCAPIQAANAGCYRAQCFETARRLADTCQINAQDYQVTFQSRLGRIPWIGPELNQVLKAQRAQGVQDLIVTCPSFVTDCLETLEEIGLRAQETWQAIGGRSLRLTPCLNANHDWVKGVVNLLKPTVSCHPTYVVSSSSAGAFDYA